MRSISKQVFYAVAIALVLIAISPLSAMTAERTGSPLLFGGCGGLYLYAPKGELWVDVYKRDSNLNAGETHLRAILTGPDRSVLDEQWIDDDGQAVKSGTGPLQHVRVRTTVDHPGVYCLNITVTNDRYGENMSWGFETNCPRYLVETSRGHKDARHEEPIVLRSPGQAGDVWFLPQPEAFSIELSELAPDMPPVVVLDSAGKELATLPVSSEGKVGMNFPPDSGRGAAPWCLRFKSCQAVIAIDGVTRWTGGQANENLSLWSPERSSWFSLHENRWLLTPYSRLVYSESSTEHDVVLTVANNGTRKKTIALAVEFDGNKQWPVTLQEKKLVLDARSSVPVNVKCALPSGGSEWKCRIRATVEDDSHFSTWSSITMHRGTAPAEAPLDIPVTLKPYRHENEQFGYLPGYPLDNQVYFDPENRPFIAATDGIYCYRDNAWHKASTAGRGDTGASIPIRPSLTKVAFDSEGGVYTVGRSESASVLLFSGDHGVSYTAWPIAGSGVFDIEQFSGHNTPDGPPPLVRFRKTSQDPKLIWRGLNDLELLLPEKKSDGSIIIGEPVLISKLCIGLSAHSGIPSTIVSRGDKVHIAWGEATDPDEKVPGVPTFVVTYDRAQKKLGAPALVGYGPPANDVHNSPCITMDSKGFLHVLIGTHGRTFKYVRSLAPNTADKGWTEAEDVGPGLEQTYVGMVCGPDDTIHLVFRLWLRNTRYFPSGYYANLAYMSKRPDEPWSEAKPLIVAPFSEYSIFYHRLTIDRRGALFLSYDYWSTFWFYRTDHRGNRRTLIMSPDGGRTWRLARGSDVVTDER